jgi:hypothetical protein
MLAVFEPHRPQSRPPCSWSKIMTKHILIALAGVSLLAGGQAVAQGRGGGHGNAGMGAAMRGGPDRIDMGIDTRLDARANSQGRFHASDRAMLRSNRNSALHYGTTTVNADTRTRTRSRGPDHASDRALARANERSVLRNRNIVRGRKPRG